MGWGEGTDRDMESRGIIRIIIVAETPREEAVKRLCETHGENKTPFSREDCQSS